MAKDSIGGIADTKATDSTGRWSVISLLKAVVGSLATLAAGGVSSVVTQGTNPWVVDTELPAAAALADNTATPTVPAVGSFLMVYDGATWDMMRGDAVDGIEVQGGVATLTADTGNPVKTGGVYVTPVTVAASGQRRNLQLSPIGFMPVAFDSNGAAGADALALMLGASAWNAGGTGGSNPLAVGLHAFNGTTLDRLRSRGTGILQVEQAFSFLHVAAGQATTTVKSGAGTLHTITHNGAPTATSTFIAYDNTAASGTIITSLLAAAVLSLSTQTYDLAFGTGLTIITAAANWAGYTVTYR